MGQVVCQRQSKYSFKVMVSSLGPGTPMTEWSFGKVSKVSFGVEVEEIREGGKMYPDKTPGFGTVDNITFERGQTDDNHELDWFRILANGLAGYGVDANGCNIYKKNIVIHQTGRDGNTKKEYQLINAFPVKMEIGDWDGEATEKVTLSMEVAYDYPIIKNTVGTSGGNVFGQTPTSV